MAAREGENGENKGKGWAKRRENGMRVMSRGKIVPARQH